MPAAPAADGLHLRVAAHADDDDKTPLFIGAADDTVNVLYLGAGGVGDNGSPGLQLLHQPAGHAVGADEYIVPGHGLFGRVDHTQSPLLQLLDNVLVMYELAEAAAASLFPQQLFRHVHRAVHAKTEARAFGKDKLLHQPTGWTPSFSSMVRQRRR